MRTGDCPTGSLRYTAERTQEQPIGRERADGVPCYLETQTEGNVAFYGKSGFDVIDERREPVCDLPIWFLRRDLRRA